MVSNKDKERWTLQPTHTVTYKSYLIL